MNNIYKIIFAFIIAFLSSCSEEFLELAPQQSKLENEFLQTFSDFEAAITGGYDQMQNSDWYGRYFLLVPDVMGEDVKQNASANRAKEWAEYNGNPLDFIPEEMWAEIYEGINITNRIINAEFTPPAVVQEEFNQVIGEAHAIRALAHFDLVRLFAQHYTFTPDASHLGIPIVTTFDKDARPARNTVNEVYQQIISDLQQAISLMTIDPANPGTFSKEAAQAILSRVYLYMEDWTNAEALASQIINSGKYALVTSEEYPTMFLNGSSSESILEMVYSITDNYGSDHIGGMYKETGYGDYLPATDLFDIIPEGDIRGTLFLEDENLAGIYGSLRVDKFPSEGASIGTDNVPVIRLSEVFLIRAEARAKLNNDTGAQEDLNLICKRGLSTAPDITLTGQALIDRILQERRIELAFEGHRVFDLTRNKLDLVRTDCTSTVCNITYPSDRFILPIPNVEINVNQNIQQNPSYGE